MKKLLSLLLMLLMLCPAYAEEVHPQEQRVQRFCPAYAETGLIFTDDAGSEITLAAAPQRTAVLFSSFADIWQLAGGETAITIGEAIERGFAPKETPLVDSGAGKTINTELLLSLKPDFVICSADLPAQADAAKLLNDAGIPAAQFHVDSFADYLRTLDIMTQITGDREAYETYGLAVQEEIQAILAASDAASPRILFIRAGSSASSTKAKTAEDHFACAMLEELGCENIADDAPLLLDGLSMEAILTADPDCIFFSLMGDEEAARANVNQLLSEPTWGHLTAVQEGRTVILPKELFHFKPNARWAEAYAYLAEVLSECAA